MARPIRPIGWETDVPPDWDNDDLVDNAKRHFVLAVPGPIRETDPETAVYHYSLCRAAGYGPAGYGRARLLNIEDGHNEISASALDLKAKPPEELATPNTRERCADCVRHLSRFGKYLNLGCELCSRVPEPGQAIVRCGACLSPKDPPRTSRGFRLYAPGIQTSLRKYKLRIQQSSNVDGGVWFFLDTEGAEEPDEETLHGGISLTKDQARQVIQALQIYLVDPGAA